MKMRDLSKPLSVSDFDGPDKKPKTKKPKTQRLQKPSKEVQLQKRNMYPGDAVFEGSHKSKVDQDITNNVYTKDGKGGIKGVTKKQKTYTHYPEGHGSTSITTSGSRTIETRPDGTSEVTKRKRGGGSKTHTYDAQGNLVSKTKIKASGEYGSAKGGPYKKKLSKLSKFARKFAGGKYSGFSKKQQEALKGTKTTYRKSALGGYNDYYTE